MTSAAGKHGVMLPLSVPDARLPDVNDVTDRTPAPSAPPDLRRRLAELRGAGVPPRALDARALAALAANPGCGRRALLDGAGIDKGAVARALGAPERFGQSQFAFARGIAFEARVKADGCAELLRLLGARTGPDGEAEAGVALPDLTAAGPEGRATRTRLALAEASAAGRWALLDHPLLVLEVAGSPAYLEPDAVAVRPDGSWTVIEIKSFPILDGGADAVKVGAAARQAAVYVLALERLDPAAPRPDVLLVCPRDFSNLPTAELVDVRKQLAVTRRQLARLTRIEEIAAALPEGTTFDVTAGRPAGELVAAVEAVPAAYAPECLATCELAFHCRDRARELGGVEALGRSVRGELGTLTTVERVLAAARRPNRGRRRPGRGARCAGPPRCGRRRCVGDDHAGARPGGGRGAGTAAGHGVPPPAVAAALVLVPLTTAGEAGAPLGALVGTDRDEPRLLVVPQPRDRDLRSAFLAELADEVLPFIDLLRGRHRGGARQGDRPGHREEGRRRARTVRGRTAVDRAELGRRWTTCGCSAGPPGSAAPRRRIPPSPTRRPRGSRCWAAG